MTFHFELVVGEEVTTRSGHVVGLFLREPIPAFRSVAETVERIHAQGGLAVAAHPLGVFLSLGTGSLRRLQADPRPNATSTRWSSSTPASAGASATGPSPS